MGLSKRQTCSNQFQSNPISAGFKSWSQFFVFVRLLLSNWCYSQLIRLTQQLWYRDPLCFTYISSFQKVIPQQNCSLMFFCWITQKSKCVCWDQNPSLEVGRLRDGIKAGLVSWLTLKPLDHGWGHQPLARVEASSKIGRRGSKSLTPYNFFKWQ